MRVSILSAILYKFVQTDPVSYGASVSSKVGRYDTKRRVTRLGHVFITVFRFAKVFVLGVRIYRPVRHYDLFIYLFILVSKMNLTNKLKKEQVEN